VPIDYRDQSRRRATATYKVVVNGHVCWVNREGPHRACSSATEAHYLQEDGEAVRYERWSDDSPELTDAVVLY
jgi:hypothetical protein